MEFIKDPTSRPDMALDLLPITPDVCQQLRDVGDRLHEVFGESVTAYEIEQTIVNIVAQFLRAMQLNLNPQDVVIVPVSELEAQAVAELRVIETGADPQMREAMIRGEDARKKAHKSDAA